MDDETLDGDYDIPKRVVRYAKNRMMCYFALGAVNQVHAITAALRSVDARTMNRFQFEARLAEIVQQVESGAWRAEVGNKMTSANFHEQFPNERV